MVREALRATVKKAAMDAQVSTVFCLKYLAPSSCLSGCICSLFFFLSFETTSLSITDLNECETDNPCKNFGTCVNMVAKTKGDERYICKCLPGYRTSIDSLHCIGELFGILAHHKIGYQFVLALQSS